MRANSTRLDSKDEDDDEEEAGEEQQETGQTRFTGSRHTYHHSDDDEDEDGTKDAATPSHSLSARGVPSSLQTSHSDVDDDGYNTEDEEERILATSGFHAAAHASKRASRASSHAGSRLASPRHQPFFSPVPSTFTFPFTARRRTRVLGLSAATCYYFLLLPLLLCFFLLIPFVLVLTFYLDLLEVLISILFALTPPLILYQFIWRRHLASLQPAIPHSVSSSSSSSAASPLASRPASDRVWYFFKIVHRTWQQELYQLALTLLSCVIYVYFTYHLHYQASTADPAQYDYVLDFDQPGGAALSLSVFIQLEYFLIASFSLDYLVGFFVAVQKWRYVVNYYALIDLACFSGVAYFSFFHRGFAPVDAAYNYYLLQGPLRFMRMRRALKALDRPMETHTSSHVLYRSPVFTFTKHHALLLLVSFRLFLYLMSTAALVLAVEFPCLQLAPTSQQRLCNEQLQRFHICVYFVVISISTVGYGDVVCVTDVGRMLMIFVVIGALLQVPAELDAWKAVKEQDKRVEETDGQAQTTALVVQKRVDESELEKRDAWLNWCAQQLLLHHKQRLPALCRAADVPFTTTDEVSLHYNLNKTKEPSATLVASLIFGYIRLCLFGVQCVRPLLDALIPPPSSAASALLPSPPSQLDAMQSLLEQVAAATRQLQAELHTNKSAQPATASDSAPAVEQSGGLDICFVLDCPGATRNYVQLVRDNLAGIVRSVAYNLAARGGVVRVAFVGNREDGHVRLQLTEDCDLLVEQLRPAPLQADELAAVDDVCDALEQALHLDWAADSTRVVALLGDRPMSWPQQSIDALRLDLARRTIHLLNLRVGEALDLLVTRWKVLGAGVQQVRQVELDAAMDDQRFRIATIANILDIDKRAVRNTPPPPSPAPTAEQARLPKRPRTAYLHFLAATQDEVQARAAAPLEIGDVAREVSAMWKRMSDGEKDTYNQLAVVDKQRYEREMAEYKAGAESMRRDAAS